MAFFHLLLPVFGTGRAFSPQEMKRYIVEIYKGKRTVSRVLVLENVHTCFCTVALAANAANVFYGSKLHHMCVHMSVCVWGGVNWCDKAGEKQQRENLPQKYSTLHSTFKRIIRPALPNHFSFPFQVNMISQLLLHNCLQLSWHFDSINQV